MRLAPSLLLPVLALLAASPAIAASAPPTRNATVDLLRPEYIQQVALSPDGRRLAYVVREGAALWIATRDLDKGGPKTTVFVDVDEKRGRLFGGRAAQTSVHVLFLGWADATTLVFAASVPSAKDLLHEEVRAINVISGTNRLLLSTNQIDAVTDIDARGESEVVQRRMRVVGFTPDAAGLLVEAVGNLRIDTSLYRVDVAAGTHRQLAIGSGAMRYLYDAEGQPRARETPRIIVTPPPLPRIRDESDPPEEGPRRPPMPRYPPRIERQDFEVRPPQAVLWRRIDTLTSPHGALKFNHDDDDAYAPRSIPLAFGAQPNQLYFASSVGHDTFRLYELDLGTGATRRLDVPATPYDVVDPFEAFSARPLIFDRDHRLVGVRLSGREMTTHWLAPELREIQQQASERFPARTVDLLDWSHDRARVLLQVSSPGDPGRLFVFDPATPSRCVEVLRRMPKLNSERLAPVTPFQFTTPDGIVLTGTVTAALAPRVTPPPLLVRCRDLRGPGVVGLRFNREAQVYAALGFMVLDVNYRGAAGLGRAHRDASLADIDHVPVADLRAAIAWLGTSHPFDRRRVALLGDRFGGYIALRALEQYPSEFRCAVVMNAPVDLNEWLLDPTPLSIGRMAAPRPTPQTVALRRAYFKPATASAKDASVLRHLETLTQPVFILQDRTRPEFSPERATRLRDALRKRGRDPEYAEILGVLNSGDPEAAAKVYTRIAGFLNGNLFDYRVDVGKERPVE